MPFKINAIVRFKNDYEISLSSGEVILINPETKEEFFLYTGKELTSKELTSLKMFDASVKPFRYVVSLLAKHSYTTMMIKDKLSARKVSEDVIEDILTRLTSNGLLNDEMYAKERANYLIKTKNAAKNAVINDLLKKGIDRFLIEDIIAMYPDFEQRQLMKIVPKLLVRNNKKSHKKAKDNIMSKLLRDGFTYSDINSALSAFTFADYINEEENLARDGQALLRGRALKSDTERNLLYNKLSKAGYPHASIKAWLEGNSYED